MRDIGREGERLAAEFLKGSGYKIVACNYRLPIGEIDIIAKDGETIVFVEVKTKKGSSFTAPFESVDRKKRQKLKNLGLLYLKNQKKSCPARFDVLSVCLADGRSTIEHIKDAFEL